MVAEGLLKRPKMGGQSLANGSSPSQSKRQRDSVEEASTPKVSRNHTQVVDVTPIKATLMKEVQGLVAIKEEPSKVIEEVTSDECDVLTPIFVGLDFVLRLLAARGVKAFHAAVKADVEAITSREMSDHRFEGVLGLVGHNVVDVRWLGAGKDAKLEVFQRAADGSERSPTVEELRERREAFKVALAAASKSGIPRHTLPPRPIPVAVTLSTRNPGLPTLPEPVAAARPAEGETKDLSIVQRKQGLLERVRARAAAGKSLEAKEYQEFSRRIGVCDNAMTAHSLLQSLFARGEGKFSAASEVEVVRGMSSTSSFAMQSMRKLSKPDTLEALELLTSRAAGWFSVETGVHNPDAKFFRRQPQGKAADALAALQAERTDLENQVRALCELTKRREQPTSQPALADGTVDVAESPVVVMEQPRPLRKRSHTAEAKPDAASLALQPFRKRLRTKTPPS